MSETRSLEISPGAGDWPLIGRRRELEQVAAAQRQPLCRGAVLVGPAGCGRSRLLREVTSLAQAQGDHLERIQATRSMATVPLGALLELVPDAVDRDDPLALMRECARVVEERAAGRPVVLAIDDAHRLDPASAALILHLASTGAAFVAATVCTGESCPDAIDALWRDAIAARVELEPLSTGDLRALLEAMLGGPIDQAAAQCALDASAGNTLYLRELVRAAVGSGALRLRNGLWSLAGRPSPDAPLIELVSERLSDLDPTEREVVELLALGEPLTAEEIAALDSSATALAIEARGLLVTAPDGVRLVPPVLREAVRISLPQLRAQALRMRLIDALRTRRPNNGNEALHLARVELEAGETVEGELALEAARAANHGGNPELAGALAEIALADRGGLAAAIVLAQARRLAGRQDEAAVVLASAEQLAPGDQAARAYARERIGLLFWELRRPDEVSAFLERMADWSDDDHWRRFAAQLRATYGDGLAEGLGDPGAAHRLATDEHLPDDSRRLGAVAHRLGLTLAGDGDRAAESAFADLPGPALSDDADLAALTTLVFVAIETGQRWDELERYLTTVMHDAAGSRTREAAGVAAFGLARLLLMRGRNRDASRWLVEAEVHLSRHDPYGTMIGVRGAAVGVAALSGDFAAANTAHERLQSWVADHEPLVSQRPGVARAGAWLEWMRNPADAGRQLLADAEAFTDEMPGLAPALAYDALRVGNRDAGELLGWLAAQCRSRIVTAFARHATARVAKDGGALLEAAEELAAIGALRYAVEAASEAGAVFVSQGRENSARRAGARARALHIPDQYAPLPTIDGLDATAIELTPREAQLLELARQGLSNAEIAERLVISIRTAETHLYRGMQKLGVSDRRDL